MSKPIITVVGATGAQGGSTIQYLVKDGKYHIRALTRNPSSDKSEKLKKLGVEIVKGDIKNRDDLVNAFKGAYGVFAVTSFWDPEIVGKDITLELTQGKLMVDVAEEQGVKHFIWSSLSDVTKISGGKNIMFLILLKRIKLNNTQDQRKIYHHHSFMLLFICKILVHFSRALKMLTVI